MSGTVDAGDLDLWEADFGRMIVTGPDFNGDQEIDGSDLTSWETGYGGFDGVSTFADFSDGDASRDGVIDGSDFLIWQRLAGKTTDVSADADGNYSVDGGDFLDWQRNFSVSFSLSATTVPEPATLMLVGVGALILPRRARSFQRRLAD